MQPHISPEDRLDILRAADLERRWHSLDDQRVCVVCERVFSGRQIEITKRGTSYSLRCPTIDCPSSCTHWFLIHPPAKKEVVVPPASGKADIGSFLP